jgi:DNA-binding PadR family transcriptional regulator
MGLDQELIILGILKNGPMHGYDIKNKAKQILEIFVGVDTESIYYPLKIMEKKGFVTKSIGRVGKRPERYIYSLSPKGENRFLELLNKSFVTISRPRFNIDLSMYFLPYMSPKEVRHRLNIRLRMLKKIKSGILYLRESGKIKLAHQLAIIEHDLELIEAEIRFVSGLIENRKFLSSARKKNSQ